MNTLFLDIRNPLQNTDAVNTAAAFLRAGEVVAMPTETVYGLAANAFDSTAVHKIFAAKGRPQDNPLIVHVAYVQELFDLAAHVPTAALRLAEKFWPGPLTIILPKKDRVPDAVSGGLSTVAVRMPSHPSANALIRAAGVPLAAPSANISGFPSPTDVRHVMDDMDGRIAAVCDGGNCEFGVESTVLTLATDIPRLLRPGSVTLEQLREVLGEVQVDDAVLHPLQAGQTASSPGMKYRHYAPLAKITVVKGTAQDFYKFLAKNSKKGDLALCFEEDVPHISLDCVTFGQADDPFSQTHRLFDALRELDEKKAKTVWARDPASDGVGLAVCNRLYRAAGFCFVHNTLTVGITGITGAGKSTLTKLFAQKGFAVVDADAIARSVTEKGSPVLAQLAEVFGEDILLPDGTLDRRKLGARAFADAESTQKLNNITHPAILERIRTAVLDLQKDGKNAVLDVPLLFETGLNELCDHTVYITADHGIRMARLQARDGLSAQEIEKRMQARFDEAYFTERSDFVLVNNGKDGLDALFEELFAKITAELTEKP
ncbi:MAG: threonylcarbamoyl-AMP synthase [Clostridia bacterium]|nr:threonylcarbamoyl-AMP synthase [Clostridia bacterium]